MANLRKYKSILSFKSSGPDDLNIANSWTKNGSLNFNTNSRIDLKSNTKKCLRYDLKNAGYITTDSDLSERDDEFTLSFWCKVDNQYLALVEEEYVHPPVRTVTWVKGTETYFINLFVLTGTEELPYGIQFYTPNIKYIFPYDLLSNINEWIHILYTKDSNNIYRVFINGIKYFEGKSNVDAGIPNKYGFNGIKIGNPVNGDYNSKYPFPVYVYLDDILISTTSCIETEYFYPIPKYVVGFYPPTETNPFFNRSLPAGKTRYDVMNDVIPITRPVYYRRPYSWEEDSVTCRRFDQDEHWASSYFDKWIPNRERPVIEYKKKF
jgi:hypothetical protein